MAPPKTKKMKTLRTPSSAQHGVDGSTNNGEDRISTLPNSILGFILTLLSVTEAVRMTSMSKMWKSVFSSPDYKLDRINDEELWCGQVRPRDRRSVYNNQSQWRSRVITSLLNARHHSIRRFIVQLTLASNDVLSGWLFTLYQSGIVEELVLKMPLIADPVGLSHSLFNCRSLCSLSLSNCCWPRRNVPAFYSPEWTLPQVTELTLSYMDMTIEDVKDLLRRCPALLSLSLGSPRRYGILDIKCKNLLSLTNAGGDWQYAIRIVDAPKLERLLWWPLATWLTFGKTMVERAPRLSTLGIFHQYRVWDEDGVMLEQVRTIALVTNVDNLEDLDRAIIMLRHTPHLETLHLKMTDGSESHNSKSKPISFEELVRSPIPCLENSVKTIVLRVNNLVRQKLAFTNFLLAAAKSVKSIIIYNKRMAGELLPPERRGSNGVQIIFGDSRKCTLQFDTSASNYRVTDPFME